MTDARRIRSASTSQVLADRIVIAIDAGMFGDAELPSACRLLVHLHDIESEHEANRRGDFGTMMERLGEIALMARAVNTVEDVLHEHFGELCAAFGFRRGLVSSVVGRRWIPECLYVEPRIRTPQTPLRHFLRTTAIDLADARLEAKCLRQHAPRLVSSPMRHKLTYKPLMRISDSHGYVVAPIVHRREAVGIVHLDQFDDEVTEDDLDRLTLLTEMLGLAVQDITRRRRLALFAEEVASVARPSPRYGYDRLGPATEERDHSPRHPSLTRRESQVFELMKLGAPNARIAGELRISVTTVKSHVGNLLAKLGVSSRAAAVASEAAGVTSAPGLAP